MTGVGWKCAWAVVATATGCLAFTLSLGAQVETTTTTAAGKATVVTKVERGEVVTVSGNDLVVKMADGSIRHFPNVPESARVTVDGKQLGVHDLKPGMKLQRTITTTSTPMTITTVQTVKGKVWEIVPPLSIILTLEDGKNQRFKIPEGQKFNVDGQMLGAFAVRKGMILTATKIVEEPVTETTQQKTLTGEAAPPPAARGCAGSGRGGERRGGADANRSRGRRASHNTSASATGREWQRRGGSSGLAGSSGVGRHPLVVYETEEPLGVMIARVRCEPPDATCVVLCGDVRGECWSCCAGAFRLLQTAIRGVTSWSLLLRQVLRG